MGDRVDKAKRPTSLMSLSLKEKKKLDSFISMSGNERGKH